MLYWHNVLAVCSFCRVDQERWGEHFFFPIFSTSESDDNGNRNLYFLMEASRPPLHRPWFNRIFRPDCTTASTLKLPQWHAHILPIYYVYALVLVNLCTLFFSRSLTLSHSASHGRSCAWELEAKQHAESSSTCDHTIYMYLYIYTRYRRPYTTHADKRHTYII